MGRSVCKPKPQKGRSRSTAVVPRAGVEPARPCGHRFLRPTRLPVPPPRRCPAWARPYYRPVRWGLFAVLTLVLTACGPELAPSAAVSPASTPGHVYASGPRISPPPVPPPTAPGTNLPAFACADASGGKTGVANAITARAAEQDGYDRFVLQFDSIVPTYTVKRQTKPVFTLGGSGQSVTLSGTAGILVTVHSATGATTFSGSTDLVHSDLGPEGSSPDTGFRGLRVLGSWHQPPDMHARLHAERSGALSYRFADTQQLMFPGDGISAPARRNSPPASRSPELSEELRLLRPGMRMQPFGLRRGGSARDIARAWQRVLVSGRPGLGRGDGAGDAGRLQPAGHCGPP